MENIKSELKQMLDEPRVSIKYRKEKSEHFGQIRTDLKVDMVLENPEQKYTVELKLPEFDPEQMRAIIDFFEDTEMQLSDETGLYFLRVCPEIIDFAYHSVHQRLSIAYKWREV